METDSHLLFQPYLTKREFSGELFSFENQFSVAIHGVKDTIDNLNTQISQYLKSMTPTSKPGLSSSNRYLDKQDLKIKQFEGDRMDRFYNRRFEPADVTLLKKSQKKPPKFGGTKKYRTKC